MFKDKFGTLSSKRITGFGVLCYTCVMVVIDAVMPGFEFGLDMVITFLGVATTLLGLGVAERNK